MKQVYKFLMSLMAFVLLGYMPSLAADVEENFGVIELGKSYTINPGKLYYGSITPSEDGYMQVYSTGSNTLRAFKTWQGSAKETMALADNNFVQKKLVVKGKDADSFSGYAYEIAVKKNVTYYLCCNPAADASFNVTVKMEPKTINYYGTSVGEGATVSPTNSTYITFNFNRPVACSAAAIVYGDNQREAVSSRASSNACTISAEIKAPLVKLASAGKLKMGDEFTVELKNVAENSEDLSDGETPISYGDVSVKVKLGALPAMLESATFDGVPVATAKQFLTYYAAGKGQLVLTFTKELRATGASATLRFGDSDKQEQGGYYQENANEKDGNFTLTIKGKQVILDFSGKNRRVVDMVSSTESNREDAFSTINIEVNKIRSTDGVLAYSESSTTSGKFNFSFELEVPTVNVTSEFTPANGSSIKNADEVEIWITDAQQINFDGVNFKYVDENGLEQVITVTDYSYVADPDGIEDGAYILTVKIPENIKTKDNVTVCLDNIFCTDGKDYSNSIAAVYNVTSTGISNITMGNVKSMKVYNLNGQLVREGNSLNGLHGVYVVNGKKVVLK